ncbi:MAG: nitrogen fixation protein NifD [Candidatus Lindowbacteria bacterium RIFCSPLOWO2_12_FULL_62_27]|nr:MAG: nitrogen fixation protein NifD [Candidatus Lindowbacteria bacterium RIFCSPLOWO2_12_FULL_62_27]OGH62186.1 MAG: nitrogen fixation protein NifD [Candidatus Lindowbacteria bacterium RIFCSPLOWO2_02_FULL_62_12]
MKLIRAVIRPEKEAEVIGRLEKEGIFAMTKLPVLGHGVERGVQVGSVNYDELSKLMLFLAVSDEDFPRAKRAIEEEARTGRPGDGKVFVQSVREAYTVRTGGKS